MQLIELAGGFIGFPDRGQAGGLGRHDVDAQTEVIGQAGDAGSDKFEDTVGDKALFEDRTAKRDCDVMRADAVAGFAGQINQHHFGCVDIISIREQLLDQFGSAFTDAHVADCTITGMGVRPQNHIAAGGHLFTCILVDNRLVDRDINAAVFFRRRQAKHMVVFVDRTADRTQ